MLGVIVSIDGSWQKRGHMSHNGVVTVIENVTGVILDYVALSNYCSVCQTGPRADSPDYAAWYATHADKCQKNIACSSGAMEVEGAIILFGRSLQKHGFRYLKMLGDGDAKTHTRLIELDPYGGRPIIKVECINHVAKRLGTALRSLKQKRQAQELPIGGRGKLTEERIKMLTNYYGRAIKDNKGNLHGMVQAVWASYYHSISTDECHHHEFCPEGPQSWCFFQRAVTEGVEPRAHSKALPADVAQAIRPVYERLSDRSLLAKCIDGLTQNSNESFHSLLWSICPKVRWACLRTVDTCLGLAVQQFNKGTTATVDVLEKIEITPTKAVVDYAENQDTLRVRTASRKSSNKEKERRKTIDNLLRAERLARQGAGGVMYGAGRF